MGSRQKATSSFWLGLVGVDKGDLIYDLLSNDGQNACRRVDRFPDTDPGRAVVFFIGSK